MPLPGIQPNRPRSLSAPEKAPSKAPETERGRAISETGASGPPEQVTTDASHLTPEEKEQLQSCLEKWQAEDDWRYTGRAVDFVDFYISLSTSEARLEDGQIVMFISDDRPPTLPALLAEKRDAAGMLMEKAKVKFICQEPAFGDPAARTSLPFAIRDDIEAVPGGEDAEQKTWVQEAPPGEMPSAQGTPREPARPPEVKRESSASSSTRTIADSSPRLSERFVNWGRNLFSPRTSGPDKTALDVLTTEPAFSTNLLTTPQSKLQMRKVQGHIDELGAAKRPSIAPLSTKILDEIGNLEPRAFKLDSMKDLTRHLVKASPFPGEKAIFEEMGKQLARMFPSRDETSVYSALHHFCETRGRLAE